MNFINLSGPVPVTRFIDAEGTSDLELKRRGIHMEERNQKNEMRTEQKFCWGFLYNVLRLWKGKKPNT
jgi:hypothetical protein